MVLTENSEHLCGVTVTNVSSSDWGDWMCLVQEGQQFKQDRKIVGLEVARKGSMTLTWSGDDNDTLSVTKGDELDLTCKIEGAYTQPTFRWAGPDGSQIEGDDSTSSQ